MRGPLLILAFAAAPTAALAGSVRLARKGEFGQVARLQLDTFDPQEEAKKPSLFESFLAGGGGSRDSREARAARLTVQVEDRAGKGSDIFLVLDEASVTEGEDVCVLGTADLSEQEMFLPTHSLSEGLYLSSMAVAANVRRCGIARCLLDAACSRAASRGAAGIFLHVERSNTAAMALYETGGFKKQPETAMYRGFTTALNLQQKEPLLLYKSVASLASLTAEEQGAGEQEAEARKDAQEARQAAEQTQEGSASNTAVQRVPAPVMQGGCGRSAARVPPTVMLMDEDDGEMRPNSNPKPDVVGWASRSAAAYLESLVEDGPIQVPAVEPSSNGPLEPATDPLTYELASNDREVDRPAAQMPMVVEDAALFAQAVAEAEASRASTAPPAVEGAPATFGMGQSATPASFGMGQSISPDEAAMTEATMEEVAKAEAAKAKAARTEAARAEAARAEAERAAMERVAAERAATLQAEYEAGPVPWWKQALAAAGEVQAATKVAMAEANAKAALERKAARPALDPLKAIVQGGQRKTLYKQLDAALDREDYEAAELIKAQIDAL